MRVRVRAEYVPRDQILSIRSVGVLVDGEAVNTAVEGAAAFAPNAVHVRVTAIERDVCNGDGQKEERGVRGEDWVTKEGGFMWAKACKSSSEKEIM